VVHGLHHRFTVARCVHCLITCLMKNCTVNRRERRSKEALVSDQATLAYPCSASFDCAYIAWGDEELCKMLMSLEMLSP
jgi:hypothetical protein